MTTRLVALVLVAALVLTTVAAAFSAMSSGAGST
jgi:hypothetical protein